MTTPLPVGATNLVGIDELREHPENPRRISRDAFESLKRNLLDDPEMLQARPLIALPDGTVIAGNMRLRAARELGWSFLPVHVVDLDAATARKWMLRDNNAFGEWDDPLLVALLKELDDPTLAGFDHDDLERLLADGRRSTADPDRVTEPPSEPRTRAGQVVLLGPHRLICGDATDLRVVAELMAGEPAAVMVTDPPYGVGVDHTWRDGLRQPIGAARTGLVANDDRHDWEAAYQLTDAPVAYVWHSAMFGGEVKTGLEHAGFDVRQHLVWVKTVHALGRANYHWRHETCWYAVRKGAKAGWRGGRKQTTVIEAPSPIMAYGGGQDDQRTPPPTQKPRSRSSSPRSSTTAAAAPSCTTRSRAPVRR